MYAFLYTINFLLMIAMPLALGGMIRRGRQIGWKLFFIGCATFVLSQVGHIPFNYFVLPVVQEYLAPLPEKAGWIISATFLGFSAAFFEEGMRVIGYRFWAKDARSWGKAMMLGAGHGGIEAIILGVIVGINTILFVAWRNERFTTLIPVEQEPIIAATLDSMFSAPWYATILGALERLFAIVIHLSLSLMVMLAFARKRPGWVLAAILFHALVDALAVFSVWMWGPYAAELLIALMAVSSLFFILRLRQPEPEEKLPASLPPPEPLPILHMEVTPDKLDQTKYSS